MTSGDNGGAMATPVEVLRNATSSKASLMLFIFNPKNYLFCCLAALSSLATFWVLLHAGRKEAFTSDGYGRRTEFCAFILLGLWGGTFSTLLQVTIQESINRFTALNNRLGKEVEGLSKEVDGLTETSERLAAELKEFDGIRTEMEQYAAEAGIEFKDLFNKTSGIFDSMGNAQDQSEFVLLQKVAADIEFMDNKAGMTFPEFRRFCMRVPLKYRDRLKEDQENTFKDVAGEDEIISYEEANNFFKRLVKECDPNPQAGS